jgi:hypothetical protein
MFFRDIYFMKTPNFSGFINEDTNLSIEAQKFVKEVLGLPGRENAIEVYANKNSLNYMDFAGAVIDEISRQFAM